MDETMRVVDNFRKSESLVRENQRFHDRIFMAVILTVALATTAFSLFMLRHVHSKQKIEQKSDDPEVKRLYRRTGIK